MRLGDLLEEYDSLSEVGGFCEKLGEWIQMLFDLG
jgi:hypothetical protein